ncbi:hypothetical protein ON010_g8690 [Phytophthora cinnamomi]|nr:hypothetical protein ON010_g8690 [Phytophthora cinnamomi]
MKRQSSRRELHGLLVDEERDCADGEGPDHGRSKALKEEPRSFLPHPGPCNLRHGHLLALEALALHAALDDVQRHADRPRQHSGDPPGGHELPVRLVVAVPIGQRPLGRLVAAEVNTERRHVPQQTHLPAPEQCRHPVSPEDRSGRSDGAVLGAYCPRLELDLDVLRRGREHNLNQSGRGTGHEMLRVGQRPTLVLCRLESAHRLALHAEDDGVDRCIGQDGGQQPPVESCGALGAHHPP